MKKRYVFTFLFLILALLVISPSESSALTKEEEYTLLIGELQEYIYGNSSMTIEEIHDKFVSLGRYEKSKTFSLYTKILLCIDKNEYETVEKDLETLKLDKDFADYLKNGEDLQIGKVDDLVNYAYGRMYEFEGDIFRAMEHYQLCISFMNTMDYYYQLISRVTPTPAPTPVPTPTPIPTPIPQLSLSYSYTGMEIGNRIENQYIVADASSALKPNRWNPSFEAQCANDGDRLTQWTEGAKGYGEGEWLEFQFVYPFEREIIGFSINIGMHDSDEAYMRNTRPKTVKVYVDESPEPFIVTFEDIGLVTQVVLFNRPTVTTKVRIELMSFYNSNVEEHEGMDTCISDVWFLEAY